MIVKDEEDMLERCLRSAAPYVAEMIVADTGSTDRTREIASACGAVVVSIPWQGHFAEARNVSLSLASQPWILVLDADEQLQSDGGPALQNLVASAASSNLYGYHVRLVSLIGAGEEYVTDSVCRLFRNDRRIRFANALHEESASSILRFAPNGIADAGPQLRIVHYGYLDETIQRKQKGIRNKQILSGLLHEHPERADVWYALGTEHFTAAEYAPALAAFEQAERLNTLDAASLPDLFLKMAYACYELGRSSEAAETADRALAIYPDFPDLLELRAWLDTEQGRYEQALRLLSCAWAAGDRSDRYSSVSGSGTYRTLYLAGLVHERTGDTAAACRCYTQALQLHPGHAPSSERLRIIQEGLSK
jgi:tetratricopeptide (TPR) repeat protein